MTILIRGGAVIPLSGSGKTVYDPGYVLIDSEGLIVRLGPETELVDPQDANHIVIDARGKAVLPGLTNAHTHLSQTFMRGLGDDKKLMDWLQRVVWPLQAAMTPDDVYLATLLGLVENILCGVTSLTEHHKIVNSPAHSDAVLRAMYEVGLPIVLAYGWNDIGPNAPDADAIIKEINRLHQTTQNTNVQIAIGPMAPWRCSDEAMQRTFYLAEQWDVPFHIHVAETEGEVGLMISRNGMRHIEWLAWLNVLSPRTQLVHAVWLTDDEIKLVKKSGAKVVHCPASNMYLASGTAKIPAMYWRGIRIALGADGSGSNNSQDMLELVKLTMLLAKIDTMDSTALLPLDGLKMAVDGASLTPGQPARVMTVNIDTPRSAPVHDPISALVYNAVGPDVDTVIVGKRILVSQGVFQGLDVPALVARCTRAAQALVRRALV
jgi:5-methylthioadenosine/S-adenosylhomocysteine deaminase